MSDENQSSVSGDNSGSVPIGYANRAAVFGYNEHNSVRTKRDEFPWNKGSEIYLSEDLTVKLVSEKGTGEFHAPDSLFGNSGISFWRWLAVDTKTGCPVELRFVYEKGISDLLGTVAGYRWMLADYAVRVKFEKIASVTISGDFKPLGPDLGEA